MKKSIGKKKSKRKETAHSTERIDNSIYPPFFQYCCLYFLNQTSSCREKKLQHQNQAKKVHPAVLRRLPPKNPQPKKQQQFAKRRQQLAKLLSRNQSKLHLTLTFSHNTHKKTEEYSSKNQGNLYDFLICCDCKN